MPTRISVHEQPPLPPSISSIRRSQAHYHSHSPFPGHLHPSYSSEAHSLYQRQSSSFSSTSATTSSQRKGPIPKNPIKVTAKPKRPSKHSSRHFSNGPRWIHRQGMINGINYHWVETTGTYDDYSVEDKPLVILLHGFPQFWYCWRHQLVPLSDAGYRVVAPDLRGFNLTDKPAAGKRKTELNADSKGKETQAAYDMETLTNDILDLIMHLGHHKAHIVGHDWGGIIAWAFAARFPEHTEKLVVMNAPHLCRWRDVATDYASASCLEQVWWTCWYTMCCQLLPSWIPETVLSYHRSWLLTSAMSASKTTSTMLTCTSARATTSLTDICAPIPEPDQPEGFPLPATSRKGDVSGDTKAGCINPWKQNSDMDLYRDAISQPGAIYALLEYYRNLWLSVQQMERYGKISGNIPILVMWGLNDKTFPREQFAQGLEEWIEKKDNGNDITVSYLDCGHYTPEEDPEEVNRQLISFLKREQRGEI